jgi:oxaloacetate decarboxylase beta subunit
MDMIRELISNFFDQMGFLNLGWENYVMIALSCVLIFLAIVKGFEPYLLIPIAVGMLLVNLDPTLMAAPVKEVGANGVTEVVSKGGLLWYLHEGVSLGIFPPLIFLGIGASTDFGPLIANPKSLILGAAAQVGIFITFLGALLLGFNGLEAASIGIIGGADGPTAIFLSNKLLGAQEGGEAMCAIIAVVAYSYMALVPIIQPPIIKGLTTKKERRIKMEMSREVTKRERIIFPLLVMILVILFIPSCSGLIGMLMLGNLIKESGVVPNLVSAAANTIMYAVTIVLGISVGATAIGTEFLKLQSLYILLLGLIAFSVATASGVLIGKVMCKVTKGKINPMIGAAGVSAVPMAARVVHKIGLEEDNTNYLLMHAMGPNVAGVIGSAVAAGLLLSIFG